MYYIYNIYMYIYMFKFRDSPKITPAIITSEALKFAIMANTGRFVKSEKEMS